MVEKSLVLIDAENILKSWQNHCRENGITEKIDYLKLRDEVSKDTNLLRTYFYDGVPEVIPLKKKNFLDILGRSGIQRRTKVLKNRRHICSKCGNKDTRTIQKGVDVSLATDILRHAWQKTCDICIVVSGDEDYKDAIDSAKDRGIKVWVASFKKSLSKELSMSADKVILLDDIFDSVKM